MSIEASELRTPEQGLELVGREGGGRGRRAAQAPAAKPTAEERLAAMRERIAKARKVEPADVEARKRHLHCRACFRNGRDAALEIIGEE